jgi:hypothetical protein
VRAAHERHISYGVFDHVGACVPPLREELGGTHTAALQAEKTPLWRGNSHVTGDELFADFEAFRWGLAERCSDYRRIETQRLVDESIEMSQRRGYFARTRTGNYG